MDTAASSADYNIAEKRHSGHDHFANVKYGYIVLFLSFAYIVYRELALVYYGRAWRRSGRSTSKIGLVDVPMVYYVTFLSLAVVILSFFNLNLDNFVIHIKRWGRIAYSLTPLDIFLSIRPSPFRLDNYLSTLKLHIWTSRVILILCLAHSVGFLWLWGSAELYKALRLVNFVGVVISVLVLGLFIINWGHIRRRVYRWFYFFHNVTAYALIVAIAYHARPKVWPIAFIDAVLIVYQLVVKFRSMQTIQISDVLCREGSDLKLVKIPGPLSPEVYLSGSHCRLGESRTSAYFWMFPSHPYTLTGVVDTGDGSMNLVVKEQKFQIVPLKEYTLQPYFPSALGPNFFHTAENINIVCGGSGISYGIPIFEYFKKKKQDGSSDIKLKFVWITPKRNDIFVLEELGITGVDVYVTDPADSEEGENYELESLQNVGGGEEQEQEEREGKIDPFADPNTDQSSTNTEFLTNTIHSSGRPNLVNSLANNMGATIDYANNWVIACGPEGLIEECRVLAKAHNSRFFSEEYDV
ncbi:hypothetical protein FOA43_003487 [Brettanomyces nanus]|uniref:FAD-binding FR-type domain-containing protein n=1 Tax=Eeniella nana TaxID=13502 RepID=A0A875S319_EENNA|nr:uncharacterized protein FOA43_003487 [Brettanomyces nanus]QPG76101.1 hypothetical protein FOA43_003487 [Brettanomyces nanus]